MVISAYATPGRSPIEGLASDYATMTAQLYSEVLGRLDELCDHPDRYRPLWAEEDASLQASEAALATGAVTIEEVMVRLGRDGTGRRCRG
jgi:predicted transcriptional regulator